MSEVDKQEMFVVVDKNDNIIGTAPRKECHSNNKIIHRAIHVFIINKKNEILIAKRSKNKDVYPGRLDFSTAGNVTAGEIYKQTAVREINEELGIEINESELIELGKLFFKGENESEIIMNFFVKKNVMKDELKLDKTEVQWAKYYKIEKIKQMLKTNESSFIGMFKESFELLCKHFRW